MFRHQLHQGVTISRRLHGHLTFHQGNSSSPDSTTENSHLLHQYRWPRIQRHRSPATVAVQGPRRPSVDGAGGVGDPRRALASLAAAHDVQARLSTATLPTSNTCETLKPAGFQTRDTPLGHAGTPHPPIPDPSRAESGCFSARFTRDEFLGRSVAPWQLRCVGPKQAESRIHQPAALTARGFDDLPSRQEHSL